MVILSLVAILAAAWIGAECFGGRGNAAAVGAILFYLALVALAMTIGYLFHINPVKVLGYVGLGAIVFVAWVILFPPDRNK